MTFADALKSFLAGEQPLSTVKTALEQSLAREPYLAAGYISHFEKLRSSGALKDDAFAVLTDTARGGRDNRTRYREPGSTGPISQPQFMRTGPVAVAAAPSRVEAPVSREISPGGSSGPASRGGWSDVGAWGDHPLPPIGPGTVLNVRFVLEEELGRGGMGIVFRARDVRKEEAQDRKPHVALKILSESFRRHPESLKALQREARRAQSLKHPNIITVYDFDRDGPTVFLVMELLEGKPLDRVIRSHDERGLAREDALRMIGQLCRALGFAHQQGIVHADLKPANVFLTHDGVIKVFDFGIARAARRMDQAGDGTTRFDARTLGALTPAYASCEMLEGLEPDHRDDIYALGCIAYELLVGKHPFDKASAIRACAGRKTPVRPKGLSSRQWQALQRALAFNRDERLASAYELADELEKGRPARNRGRGIAAASMAALAVVAGAGWFGVRAFNTQLVAALESRDSARVAGMFAWLDRAPAGARSPLLVDRTARNALARYGSAQVRSLVDPAAGRYSLAKASDVVSRLESLLPNAAELKPLALELGQRREEAVARIVALYEREIAAQRVVDGEIPRLRSILRSLDPTHVLLRDARLPAAYLVGAKEAFGRGEFVLAQRFVDQGLTLFPRDAALSEFEASGRRAAEVLALEAQLRPLIGGEPDLAQFRSRGATIARLASLAPQSAVVLQAQGRLEAALKVELTRLVRAREQSVAQELLATHAESVRAEFTESMRELIGATSAAQGDTGNQAKIQAVKSSLAKLLRDGKGDEAWELSIRQQISKLGAYLPRSDAYFAGVRANVAKVFLAKAQQHRTSWRLADADWAIARAREYQPESSALASEEALLATAKTEQATVDAERAKEVASESQKQKVLDLAEANEIDRALAAVDALKSDDSIDRAFLDVAAPRAISSAYLRTARIEARAGRFAKARDIAAAGFARMPNRSELSGARDRFSEYIQIDRTLRTGTAADATASAAVLKRLESSVPDEVRTVAPALALTLVARVSVEKTKGNSDVADAFAWLGRDAFAETDAIRIGLEKLSPTAATSTGGVVDGAGAAEAVVRVPVGQPVEQAEGAR